MTQVLRLKLQQAYQTDPDIFSERGSEQETLGSDVHYLEDILHLDKSDLIRLEREGLAFKARYEMRRRDSKPITGTHRTRWVIYKEALDVGRVP